MDGTVGHLEEIFSDGRRSLRDEEHKVRILLNPPLPVLLRHVLHDAHETLIAREVGPRRVSRRVRDRVPPFVLLRRGLGG